jgi:repressor LexA
MSDPLSKMERRILDYLVDYLKRNTYQPSIREIGRRFGIKSTKTVSEYLQALADKGFIEREASRSRGVRIVGLELQSARAVTVPLYGSAAYDEPKLMRDRAEAEYFLDPKLAGAGETFFVEARGSSDGIGVVDGDLVLVEPVAPAALAPGDVVATRVGTTVRARRCGTGPAGLVLEPDDEHDEPAPLREHGEGAVLGRVIGLFRRFAPHAVPAVSV